MDKLPMCRMCLVEDVRMYIVDNKNLHELYMKLTDTPFVTEDRRPMLACFFCYARLKQCCGFLRNCLKAEELFVQILNEDYEPNPLINRDQLVVCGGFVKTTTDNIDVGQCESIAIKEELPAVCEGLDDNIEPKEEHQSDDTPVAKKSKLDTRRRTKLADITSAVTSSEVEVRPSTSGLQTASERVVDGSDLDSDTPVAKKPKLDTRRTKLADITSAVTSSEVEVRPSTSRLQTASERVVDGSDLDSDTPVAKKPKLDTRRTKLADRTSAVTSSEVEVRPSTSGLQTASERVVDGSDLDSDTPVAKKPKLDTRRTKLADITSAVTSSEVEVRPSTSRLQTASERVVDGSDLDSDTPVAKKPKLDTRRTKLADRTSAVTSSEVEVRPSTSGLQTASERVVDGSDLDSDTPVAKKPKLDTRRTKLADRTSAVTSSEVEVRPSTSGLQTASEREVVDGSDLDSEFDDEFDVDAMPGRSRKDIPDTEELEEPMPEIVFIIDTMGLGRRCCA